MQYTCLEGGDVRPGLGTCPLRMSWCHTRDKRRGLNVTGGERGQ